MQLRIKAMHKRLHNPHESFRCISHSIFSKCPRIRRAQRRYWKRYNRSFAIESYTCKTCLQKGRVPDKLVMISWYTNLRALASDICTIRWVHVLHMYSTDFHYLAWTPICTLLTNEQRTPLGLGSTRFYLLLDSYIWNDTIQASPRGSHIPRGREPQQQHQGI